MNCWPLFLFFFSLSFQSQPARSTQISGERFPAARFQKELEISPRVVLASTPTVLSSQETIEKLRCFGQGDWLEAKSGEKKGKKVNIHNFNRRVISLETDAGRM